MVLGDCINAVSTVYLDTALMQSPKIISIKECFKKHELDNRANLMTTQLEYKNFIVV